MSGTPEYELAALEGKPGYNQALAAYRKKYGSNTAPTPYTKPSATNSLREELEAYSHDELVKYYQTAIDPDATEDLSGMDEADLIEAILEKVQEMTGGKRRRKHKQRKSYRKKRATRKQKTYKRKQRKSRKNRRN